MISPKRRTLALAAVLAVTPLAAPNETKAATLPGGINQQGFLTDDQGRPLDGRFEIEARLYTAPTRGTAVYSELHLVQVENGLYNIALGQPPHDRNSLQNALGAGAVHLELVLNGKTLGPRIELRAAPFAIWSHKVGPDSVDSEQIVAGAVTADKIAAGAIMPEAIDNSFKRHYNSQFDAIAALLDNPALEISRLRETACSAAPQSPLNLVLAGQVFTRVLAFQAHEAISALPRTVVLFEAGAKSSAAAWVDTDARLSYVRNGAVRHYPGIVTHAAKLGGSDSTSASNARFAIVIEPPAARLRYNQQSRIFQEQTIFDIAAERFNSSGQAFSELLNGSALPRSQLIQYQETDLAFTHRVLEREGIWFGFDASSPSSTMLLRDEGSGHLGAIELSFYGPQSAPGVASEEFVQAWVADSAQHSGAAALKGYPNQTGSVIEQSFALGSGLGTLRRSAGRIEGTADLAAQARAQAQEAWHAEQRSGGFSNAAGLSPGQRLTIVDRSGAGQSDSYFLTGVLHTGLLVSDADNCVHYANRFSITSTSVPFRPRRSTPTPRIPGLSSAVVTGPAGETRHTDEMGRIKVRFHWDDQGANDDTASAWVPVLKSFHGRNQSAFWIPEVGDEVLVSFINGDPDRPVVVGAIANQLQPPPMALPDDKFKTSIGSRSGNGTLTQLELDSTPTTESLTLKSNTVAISSQLQTRIDTGLDLNVVAGDEISLKAGAALELDAPLTIARGALQSTSALGPSNTPLAGGYYRDNSIIAWARISSVGTVTPSFGVDSVSKIATGHYLVDIARALASTRIIPIAVAEVDKQPQDLTNMRIASVNQLRTGVFEIFVNDGSGRPVDNDVLFIAAGGQ